LNEKITAGDYRKIAEDIERLDGHCRRLRGRYSAVHDLPLLRRSLERRRIERDLKRFEKAVHGACERLLEEESWRSDNRCPPGRTRIKHERFLAERERVQERHDLPMDDVETWEQLRAWERYAENKEEYWRREKEAERRGGKEEYRGPEERDRERRRQQFDCGVIDRETFEREEREARFVEDISWVREDLRLIRDYDQNPDTLHDPEPYMNEAEQRMHLRRRERRPEMEREVEAAKLGGRELTEEDQELAGLLDELRKAEHEARELRSWEQEEREDEPPGGSPIRGGGPGSGIPPTSARERPEQDRDDDFGPQI
jgi:hypothetical protein